MTASIFWAPVKPEEPKSINAPAPSWFIETLERAGLGFPGTLSVDDLPTLRGMAAMRPDDYKPNPHQELINAIQEHGIIEIWRE